MKVDSKYVYGILLIFIVMFCGFSGLWINTSIKENAKYEEEMRKEEKEKEKERNIGLCLDSAYESYRTRWESACKKLKLGEDCRLPSYEADAYDSDLKQNEEMCIKRFK